ncbi:VirB3 family type IV secretion system protein [Neisseria sp. Ec49-e6-T10]|uniref:VirB3 family type IV secretion system protein n=1 Tax=Neisseria sp. Ec49-e6-T10 TaxID=3140744 RepID=UPI003EBBD1DC
MKENPINRECPTFNALSREAMVWGIPLIALAISGFVTVMAVMAALPFLQGKAMLFLLLPIPFLLFLKTISANDDQAFKIILLEVKWFFRKKNIALFNGTLTIISTKFGRNLNDYERFFEQCSKKTACSIRFSAENLPTRHG